MNGKILHLVGSQTSDYYYGVSRVMYAPGCIAALPELDHLVLLARLDGTWSLCTSLDKADHAERLSLPEALGQLGREKIACVQPHMFDYKGMVSTRSIAELLDIPMVGSPGEVMALTTNKWQSRAVVASHGVSVPKAQLLRPGDKVEMRVPLIIKPCREDNSMGITLVQTESDIESALIEGFKYDDQLLCEQFIPLGRELRRLGAEQPYRSQLGKFMHKSIDCSGDSTIDHSSGLQLVFLRIGVVDGEDDELEFLPVIEYFLGHKKQPIRTSADKISSPDGTANGMDFVDIDEVLRRKLVDMARRSHEALGCRHYSLYDVRVDPEGNPFFIEASPYCSFSPKSVIVTMSRGDPKYNDTDIFYRLARKAIREHQPIDSATIESVMSTTITTTIKIARDVLQPSNRLLFDVYKPLGRCVAVVDDKVEAHFGADLEKYFEINGIEFVKLVFSGNEVDKNLSNVEQILLALKENWQARHEPVLIVGGGVIADVAGMACALYSRNTPYVMLCTSLVAGIDAGPSPRVCCNGFSYKNLYGAYHPPALTITDRGFWRTMHPGQLRHGVAEIIKVAAMADLHLFELMEKWGKETVATNFGTLGGLDDPAFQEVCDLIIGKAMEGYVRAEYGNLWETHQCRPHAYGHTWSPGYELPSGMLHGHAVGTCMGFGAYLSYKEGWLSEVDMHRVLKVISDCELALWHPVMEDTVSVWKAQIGIVEKRGGNLCAPIPRALGESGYLNSLPERLLHQRMHEYQELCSKYPREGRGVQEHSVDVGLEDPMSKKDSIRDADRCVVTPMDRVVVQLGAASQSTSGAGARAIGEAARIVDGIDEMVTKYSSQPSEALKNVSKRTAMTNPLWAELMGQGNTSRLMEAEMISGQAEAQLLQLLLKLSGGKDVLDIGTFTGYSSLAMAEAIPEDGTVVTLEREQEAKDMAKANWIGSPHASKIESLVGEAHDLLICLAAEDKSFDLVFLDVDKPGYFGLYQMLMDKNLLKVKGLLVVDNVMYKGEELSGTELTKNGQGAQALNQGLLDDPRVQQVMLPLRDGVTLTQELDRFKFMKLRLHDELVAAQCHRNEKSMPSSKTLPAVVIIRSPVFLMTSMGQEHPEHQRDHATTYVKVFAFDAAVTDELDNKFTFNQVLVKAGLPCPETAKMECLEDALQFFEGKSTSEGSRKYIVKPAVYDPKARTEILFLPIEDEKQLEYLKSRNASKQVPYVIQEVLQNPEYGCYALYNKGALTGFEFFESAASCLRYRQESGKNYDDVKNLCAGLGKAMNLTGQLTLDLMHNSDGAMLPIECNPRIHSAVCTLEGHKNLGLALADEGHVPSDADVVTSSPKTLKYWIMDQVFLRAGFWKHKNCFKLSLWEMLCGTDALLHGDDPLPFLTMYLVQIPSLLLLELVAGTPWLKIDFCIGKIVKEGGD
eukprot:g1387.t1